jgi:hypothetical protein
MRAHRTVQGWVGISFKAVSQLPWPDKDREVWFSLGENHEKAYRFPDFLQRSAGREQRYATFFAESRMQFGIPNKIYRKSGFGLHQLRNWPSGVTRSSAPRPVVWSRPGGQAPMRRWLPR